MNAIDDRIRTAMQVEMPEPDSLDIAEIAGQLVVRAAKRTRARRRTRLVGVGLGTAAAMLVVAGALALGSAPSEPVAPLADLQSDAGVAKNSNGQFGYPSGASGYRASPELDRSLTDGLADLILVGEVRGVSWTTSTDAASQPGPGPTTVEGGSPYLSVDVDVHDYLVAKPGIDLPNPLRMRVWSLSPEHADIVSSRTWPVGATAPGDRLAVGTKVLVFSTAPTDTGDGLAATPSYIFLVSQDGVINEDGRTVPMEEVVAALTQT